MGEITPAGKERRFYLTEADKALDDAAIMKKIAKGWSAFGEHPWWVVHGKPEKQMARYNSDSVLNQSGVKVKSIQRQLNQS